jgi:hypothetical protein
MTRPIVLALLVLVITSASGQEIPARQQTSDAKFEFRDSIVAFHHAAVGDVTKGKSLDSEMSPETLRRFRSSLPADGYAAAEKGLGPEENVTYRRAIKWSEDAMVQFGTRVTVTVLAAPGGCSVKYKPVIGGAVLDAGTTKTVTRMDPRWYDISCDCQTPPLVQRVDCTDDKTVAFSCPAPANMVKPSEKR